MLKRSVADRKIAALAKGRDLYLGLLMIRQLTDGPYINHPTYFLQSSFFPGDRELFFTSYRTGEAQVFAISLDSGETRQLTHGAPHPSVFRGAASGRQDHRGHPRRRPLGRRRGTSPKLAGGQLGECSHFARRRVADRGVSSAAADRVWW